MADAGLDRSDNLRAGVFIGIALDLNSTNFSLNNIAAVNSYMKLYFFFTGFFSCFIFINKHFENFFCIDPEGIQVSAGNENGKVR